MKSPSRHVRWLTKDPKRRIETYVSPYHWALFQIIRDSGRLTQHEAVELGLEALCLQMIISGDISEKAYCATRIEWWKREANERAANEDANGGESGQDD